MTELAQALRDLDEKKVYALVDKKIEEGTPATSIIAECNEGIVAVGQLFSEQKYYISQLIFSAEIFKQVIKRIEPLLESTAAQDHRGKVIIGTVKGDIHDIGKNLVITLLRGAGFEVIDLGVDVPAEKFVEAAKDTGARVVGMSALLNFTYPEMKNVVDALAAAGLRDQVKVIVGGAPVNEKVRDFAGADFYAEDAVQGVNICKEIYA
ncbi:methylmalonyl-CoA mutase C-terminal domain-containing protein [Desulfacinum infernum DSM 9756]|uniref:Methylmalonyl-CoA mutase C-terminal domain-containing protein n=1 Tax=Desulfacinum infernum DSM 9756 TaxID=1121391 RepID=A0A1M4Z384_9BACT|nr:corrinoid protein [Desulfacinum infernum]MBC7358338.1 corrinoid protein [Desulfacinum sp.]SHF12418.1 methylmalonyl-CoA mutase C-terminal domain-containing protein [Desulfacinum infernum DSM 9756]